MESCYRQIMDVRFGGKEERKAGRSLSERAQLRKDFWRVKGKEPGERERWRPQEVAGDGGTAAEPGR